MRIMEIMDKIRLPTASSRLNKDQMKVSPLPNNGIVESPIETEGTPSSIRRSITSSRWFSAGGWPLSSVTAGLGGVLLLEVLFEALLETGLILSETVCWLETELELEGEEDVALLLVIEVVLLACCDEGTGTYDEVVLLVCCLDSLLEAALELAIACEDVLGVLDETGFWVELGVELAGWAFHCAVNTTDLAGIVMESPLL